MPRQVSVFLGVSSRRSQHWQAHPLLHPLLRIELRPLDAIRGQVDWAQYRVCCSEEWSETTQAVRLIQPMHHPGLLKLVVCIPDVTANNDPIWMLIQQRTDSDFFPHVC